MPRWSTSGTYRNGFGTVRVTLRGHTAPFAPSGPSTSSPGGGAPASGGGPTGGGPTGGGPTGGTKSGGTGGKARIGGLYIPDDTALKAATRSVDPTLDLLASGTHGTEQLIRQLKKDLGPIDAEGRPEKGHTVWWFAARMDALNTRGVQWREKLASLLSRIPEHPYIRKMIRDEALTMLFEGKTVLMSANQASAIASSRSPEGYKDFLAERECIENMIDAAIDAVVLWFEDPSAKATPYFGLRNPGGMEYAMGDKVTGEDYTTLDDQIANIAWTKENRDKEVSCSTSKKPHQMKR